MRSPSLLLLLIPTAGAFSPASLQTQQSNIGIGISTPRCTANHRSCREIGFSPRQNAAQPLFFHNVNTNNNDNLYTTTTSLAMSTAAAATRQFNYKKRIAILMAFMTGWADTLFLKKYGYFATMMTGNSMKLGDALVAGRMTDGAFFATVIVSYIFGVGIFRRAELSYKNKAMNGLFAPIVAGFFCLADYLQWVNPKNRFSPAILLSFAWGIINSVGSEATGTLVFVLTGAMTRIANAVVDRISRTAGRKKIPKEGLLMSLGVIGGFILGSAWCAFLGVKAPQLVTRGAFSIMGGVYGLLFLFLDREELGAWWQGDGELCDIDAEEVDCK